MLSMTEMNREATISFTPTMGRLIGSGIPREAKKAEETSKQVEVTRQEGTNQAEETKKEKTQEEVTPSETERSIDCPGYRSSLNYSSPSETSGSR